MRYCNLKFGYNKAGVKSTDFQNWTGKNTPWQTKPHQNLMELKMCLVNCIVTKPHHTLARCVFFTNTVKVGAE